jgi:hypothetical protein
MKESEETAKVVAALNKTRDAWFFKHVHSQYGRSGIPDVLGCINGVFFAIEVKLVNNINYTKIQQVTLKRMAKAGCLSMGLVINPESRNRSYALDNLYNNSKTHLLFKPMHDMISELVRMRNTYFPN